MKDYVDARDEAVESRLVQKLDKLPSTGTLWVAVAAVAGSIFTGVAILIGTLSFGGDRFDGGMSVSGVVEAVRADQQETDARQDRQLSEANDKLDILIDRSSE